MRVPPHLPAGQLAGLQDGVDLLQAVSAGQRGAAAAAPGLLPPGRPRLALTLCAAPLQVD